MMKKLFAALLAFVATSAVVCSCVSDTPEPDNTDKKPDVVNPADHIAFEDAEVKRVCVENWDTDGDGELSYAEAAAVSSLDNKFKGNKSIAKFHELKHFTGLATLKMEEFLQCSLLEAVTLPNTITTMERSVFYECSSLKELTIPDSVTSIDIFVLFNCPSLAAIYGKYASADNRCLVKDGTLYAFAPGGLTEYTIPDGVVTIECSVFACCTGLKKVTMPDSVVETKYSVFNGCTNLAEVVCGKGYTTVGEATFYQCSSLTKINLPQNLRSIANAAFYDCSLLNIDLPAGLTTLATNAFGGTALTKVVIPQGINKVEDGTFAKCYSLTEVTLHEGITAIGEGTFYYCTALPSITIPSTVTELGSAAFSLCMRLKDVYCKPTTPPTLGTQVFYPLDSALNIHIPSASFNSYMEAWFEYSTNIRLPN